MILGILGRLTDSANSVDDYIPTARSVGGGSEQGFKTKLGAMKVTPAGGTADTLENLTALSANLTGHPVQCAQRLFTETTAAGVYTGSVSLPAGATLLDVIVDGITLWAAGTSATMTVGDAGNASGLFASVNLKATDLLAGESISFDQAGGKAGAYIANSQVSPRYSATARVISGVVTTVGTGATGVTRMTVLWCAPTAAFISSATKV
jgi:hypothetical protein